MKAFVITETAAAARELCARARTKADEVILVAVGVPATLGVSDRTLHIEVPEGNIIDDAYLTLCEMFDEHTPDLVLIESTRRMKVLAGRLAAHVGTAVITDVVEFEGNLAINMFFGGVAYRKSRPLRPTALYTLGLGLFDDPAATGTDVVEEVPFKAPAKVIKRVSAKDLPASEVDLAAADVIVAVGRGFSEEADLQLARDFAGKIRGELGCSRPLAEGVDWMPREAYIGVSGVMTKPKVYVGVGISGQMQHMVGVNRAQTIVAINKDKNAPIFKQADYGIVGDLKKVLPMLTGVL